MTNPQLILVVEDSTLVTALLTEMLKRAFPDDCVVCVATGAAALEVLDRSPVAVVISDYTMPGMNGLSLLAQVAQRWPDTYRVLLSGSTPPDADRAQAAGVVDAIIIKPFEPMALVEAVRQGRAA